MPRPSENPGRYDDVADDAMAAYAEALERAGAEAAAPRERPAEREERVIETRKVEATPEAKVLSREKHEPDNVDTRRQANGQFAKKADKPGTEAEGAEDAPVVDKVKDGKPAAKAAGVDAPPAAPEAAAAVANGPPPSWSIKAKAMWGTLPPEIQADVIKRENEAKNGLQGLQEFRDLKPYVDLAKQNNTTVAKALDRYMGIENLLKRDVGAGLATIAQNSGLDQRAAANLFASLAQRFGGAPIPGATATGAPQPSPTGLDPNDPLMAVLRPILQPLVQEVTGLKAELANRQQAAHSTNVETLGQAIEKFSADPANTYFTNLEETITRLFETGMVPLTGKHETDLRVAYDMAARMNPEVQQALIEQRLEAERSAAIQKDQGEANKAKKASRSMSGNRIPGTVIKERTEEGDPNDVEADVRRAYRMVAQA